MVPGSTLRYGSHFWRVTRRPRLSSRQPIEAAATAFPREETTPPVTKMYFGAVRKSGENLRDNLRTKHYAGIRDGCQIANFLLVDLFFGWEMRLGKTKQRGHVERRRI